MKENIFDVLMYLFENYMEDEIDDLPNSDVVRTELLEAGFAQIEVIKAFEWLESLSAQRAIRPSVAPSFRIFCKQEQDKLDVECRDLILFLEHIGILNSVNREIVIDQVMVLDDDDISLDKLKWIVLMVLLSQPDEEVAFSRMENFVYDFSPLYLH
jgi:Smg protein